MKHLILVTGALLTLGWTKPAAATCSDDCSLILVQEDCTEVGALQDPPVSWPADQPLAFKATCSYTCCAPGGPGGGSHTCSSGPSSANADEFLVSTRADSVESDVRFEEQETACGTLFIADSLLADGEFRIARWNLISATFDITSDAQQVDTGDEQNNSGGPDQGSVGVSSEDSDNVSSESDDTSGCQYARAPTKGSGLVLLLAFLGLIALPIGRRAGSRKLP